VEHWDTPTRVTVWSFIFEQGQLLKRNELFVENSGKKMLQAKTPFWPMFENFGKKIQCNSQNMKKGVQFEHQKQLQPSRLLCNEVQRHQLVVFLPNRSWQDKCEKNTQ
jgi:hypothetical protein